MTKYANLIAKVSTIQTTDLQEWQNNMREKLTTVAEMRLNTQRQQGIKMNSNDYSQQLTKMNEFLSYLKSHMDDVKNCKTEYIDNKRNDSSRTELYINYLLTYLTERTASQYSDYSYSIEETESNVIIFIDSHVELKTAIVKHFQTRVKSIFGINPVMANELMSFDNPDNLLMITVNSLVLKTEWQDDE